MKRRIVGNLDFEHDLAHSGAMSAAAAARIAPLATLLRVFADEEDSIWTPSTVDPSLVPRVPGLPNPTLENGPFEDLPPVGESLAWGQSVACVHLAAKATGEGRGGGEPPSYETRCLHRHVWSLPRASAEVAKAANDRRFFLKVARDFQTSLPGSDYFRDLAGLETHLQTQPSRKFVLKAPFSASGRARLVFERDAILDPKTRDRITTLLAKQGGALLEPWMDRTDDFGALGLINDRGVAFLGLHRQHVTAEGQFVGITLRPFSVPRGLSKEETAELTVAARRVGEALFEFGYRGPYSVDSWRYRLPDGKTRVQPIGEINARMTMGLVARVAAERVFGHDCVDEVAMILDDETTPAGPDAIVILNRPRVVLARLPVE